MDTIAIKALIDKYDLHQVGDKIGTHKTKGIDPAAFRAEVGPHKAEIIQYFEMERQAAKAKVDAERAAFEAIPGVSELRDARKQAAKWQVALSRMIESGNGRIQEDADPTAPKRLAELEEKYPMAVFALEAEWRKSTVENDRLYTIWSKTYQALCNGESHEKVKADHDARMSEFAANVFFD